MGAERKINFSAGPATLPESVLETARDDMLNWNGCGMGVMELSHRSAEFGSIIKEAEESIRKLWTIPDNYKVLFLQGGATTQFSAVPMNLIGKEGVKVDYFVTGNWSQKAAKEAGKYATVNLVVGDAKKYTTIPDESEWNLDPEAAYVYYCANETVWGIEFDSIPDTKGVPLVCDMSSSFLSRDVDVSKFGILYGGAQKNIGMAGVTMVIIREDLVGNALPSTPLMLDYGVQVKGASMSNTPPTYGIYITGLVFKWIQEKGGIEAIEKANIEKAKLLYEAIDKSGGFYECPVESKYRSRMNVPFRIKGGDEDLEAKFISFAQSEGMTNLKGHRSVGGIRASLYNAMHLAGVEFLVAAMANFKASNA